MAVSSSHVRSTFGEFSAQPQHRRHPELVPDLPVRHRPSGAGNEPDPGQERREDAGREERGGPAETEAAPQVKIDGVLEGQALVQVTVLENIFRS